MCGIGGILRTDGQPIPEEWLDAIDARIAWRGPDGHGRFRDRVEFSDEKGEKRVVEVAFVHRRLSIIDHEGGAQPMVSEHGRNEKEGLVAVVFNGCIYNHCELRRELESRGHRFVSDHSDTEVLIHGWREWGEHLIDYLEGMFALAIWDRTQRKLAVARDRFGEKPLSTIPSFDCDDEDPVILAFSSDAASMFAIRPSKERCAPPWIQFAESYLRLGYVAQGSGIFRSEGDSASDVMPGTIEVFEMTHETSARRAAQEPARGACWEDIDSLLEAAVARRLEADVELGCFLSGGIDSSLIAMFATRHCPEIRTFTVRMPDTAYDESQFAETVARYLKLRHVTLDVAKTPADDLRRLICLVGQPFGDSSILPTYWVCKAAREHAKVALSGDGGDELFVGYERYLVARYLGSNWKWLRRLPTASLRRFDPKSRLHKLSRLRDMAADYPGCGIAVMEAIFTETQILSLTGSAQAPVHQWSRLSDPLDELRQFDIDSYLPGDLLRKVDTASMACGLEVRCPFLDRDLARAALSMPIDQLMPGGQRKGLLRQIARKYLPKEIVDRPKMGFAIPIGEWFRTDYGQMKTLLLDHLNATEPFGPIQLNRKAVQRFIDEHMSGKRDHGQRLFTLLTLSIWAGQQMSKSRNVETSK